MTETAHLPPSTPELDRLEKFVLWDSWWLLPTQKPYALVLTPSAGWLTPTPPTPILSHVAKSQRDFLGFLGTDNEC